MQSNCNQKSKRKHGQFGTYAELGAILKMTDLIDTFEIPSKSVIYWSILHIVHKIYCDSSQT